jgi:four helix bundle protein
MANTLDELPLYIRVLEFWDAVTEILRAPRLRNDRRLCDQIERANDSIDANMKEGFEQPSDAAFSNFVFIAKASTAEVLARMKQARRKGYIDDDQLARVLGLGEPLGRMMGGFIKYLAASGFTDRGRHSVAPTPRRPANTSRPRRHDRMRDSG